MTEAMLTREGSEVAGALAAEYGVSPDAVTALAAALAAGGGSQAQFSHPELGGMGQWSRGGMIMIGDMFNTGLKARVGALATAIAAAMARGPLVAAPAGAGRGWWPAELGSPGSSGAQNDMRYAYFTDHDRLVVDRGGAVTVYDTSGHRISGVGQQQSGAGSVRFRSDRGDVDLTTLPVVGGAAPAAPTAAPGPAPHPAPAGDAFATIERLGALREKGLVTEEEFAAKKAELLARL